MSTEPEGDGLLCELARTMDSRQDYVMAIALRKLARAGYTTLGEVDAASDLVLLATPEIGLRRLEMVRRLVRPDWQPPPPKVTTAAERFLTAARFALSFWPADTLESVLRGSSPLPTCDRPVEKRLAVELFSVACRKALRHCALEELAEALQQAGRFVEGGSHPNAQTTSSAQGQLAQATQRQGQASRPVCSNPRRRRRIPVEDSDRYAFSRERRLEIVESYRAARARGEVANKDHWARSHFSISAKTLVRYEREFPESNAEA
ncbi:MAG: hypothetical protein JXA14_02235 [Anaerolineae bacterium]|nr:hypothetical protein [Anaerolineae bacterium]